MRITVVFEIEVSIVCVVVSFWVVDSGTRVVTDDETGVTLAVGVVALVDGKVIGFAVRGGSVFSKVSDHLLIKYISLSRK